MELAHTTSDKEFKDLRKEYTSPSGKYSLVIRYFKMGPNVSMLSQGMVFKKNSTEPMHIVNRNYSSFPFLWIEDHKSGHDFLVCGEDYQGQTVIDLTTEARADYRPLETKNNESFCWSEFKFDPTTSILTVCGCVWACPFEYRFYDFSSPIAKHWAEIVPEHNDYMEADEMWPTIEEDGTIKVYQTYWEPDNEESGSTKIVGIRTFRRDGNVLKLIKEWISEEEKLRRKDIDVRVKWEKWYKNYQATDVIYLEHLNQLQDPIFNPASHTTVGITNNGWCSNFNKEEHKVCRRIVGANNHGQWTIDLEWGALSAPIKVIAIHHGEHYVSGKPDAFFDHSVEGMQEAFKYIKSLLQVKPKNFFQRTFDKVKTIIGLMAVIVLALGKGAAKLFMINSK